MSKRHLASSFRAESAQRGSLHLRAPFARRISRRLFLCLITSLFLLSSPLLAKELRIERFNAQIDVLPDSSVSVAESITVHFLGGPWHGLYREIPVEYFTAQGMNYSLFLDVKRITDSAGHPLKYESSRERHYRKLKIFIDNADNSVQTINIEYTVADALKFHEDFDEFYWNVTGDEWDVPINSASATITLPSTAKNIRANFATGAYGSHGQDAQISVAGNGVEVHTTAPLPYHHGLTVAVAFDKGALREPTAFDKTVLFLRSNWPLLLPVFVALIMYWIWYTNGRDPRLRPIAAQYEPPDQLTPSEVGTLVDNSADMRDITAAIVDLAVRGYIVIQERSESHMMGLYKSQDYSFILKKPRSEWTLLKPHEQSLLDGIFVGQAEEVVDMADLHNVFYKSLPIIKNQVFGQLVNRGYYLHRPDTVRSTYIGAGVVIGFLAIWGGAAIGRSLGMAGAPFIIAGIFSAAIICGFGWFMPARTSSGTRALEGALGFEDFLAHVESDRFNRMIKTPEMFEKFLPFAMALGVEKNWSKAFANIYTEPPSWYQGGNLSSGFYPYMFVNNINAMSSQAATTFASAPRSSGGSGFSGGGGSSSGGGFGGGGGGGF
jgi:uncharacterized membrane protein YgcG